MSKYEELTINDFHSMVGVFSEMTITLLVDINQHIKDNKLDMIISNLSKVHDIDPYLILSGYKEHIFIFKKQINDRNIKYIVDSIQNEDEINQNDFDQFFNYWLSLDEETQDLMFDKVIELNNICKGLIRANKAFEFGLDF